MSTICKISNTIKRTKQDMIQMMNFDYCISYFPYLISCFHGNFETKGGWQIQSAKDQ